MRLYIENLQKARCKKNDLVDHGYLYCCLLYTSMSAAEALAPERSVDEVRESLSVTEKGQPANTIGNCRTVFCHDPLLRLSLIHILRSWRKKTRTILL